MSDHPRLHKVLADAGLGSRRAIEGWIRAGRIKLNGRIAELGACVAPGDRIHVDDKPVAWESGEPASLRVIVYNKPEGEICARSDPEGRPTVFAALPRLDGGRWIIVGRLDLNTTGVLLATTSGELANRLMHPSSQVEREYLVRVLGEVDAAVLQRLRNGVELDDGPAAFDGITERGGSGSNRWFAVVLREGRNREVRRLWESQGLRVSRLKRVRFGPVALSARQRPGAWRDLDALELERLLALVGMQLPAPAASPRPRERGGERRPASPGGRAVARDDRERRDGGRQARPETRRDVAGRGGRGDAPRRGERDPARRGDQRPAGSDRRAGAGITRRRPR